MPAANPVIAVVNVSTVLTDAQIDNALPAIQSAITSDFAPIWDATATIVRIPKGSAPPVGAWVCTISDTSDQAGALAYHSVTNGLPSLSVFAKTEQQYGASWTVSLTHEIWEALVDPYCGSAFQISQRQLVALETADPVEADRLGYTRPGKDGSPILISNFVTPHWFVAGSSGPYDFNKKLSSPLSLASGGYVSIATAGANGLSWSQKQMKNGELIEGKNPYGDDDEKFNSRRVRDRDDRPAEVTFTEQAI